MIDKTDAFLKQENKYTLYLARHYPNKVIQISTIIDGVEINRKVVYGTYKSCIVCMF